MINSDLKYIKKHYGEKFAHLCRDLFPTILETEGLLKDIITKHFAPSRNLYYDIVENFLQDEFKSYIYSFVDVEQDSPQSIDFSPEELMRKAGYILYPECQTEEDIQKFRKYYASGEELCTFGGQRLKSCRVWFAVKENVDEIKRENFPHPTRQDEYGTSVISIQFSRTGNNYLSIKNRYNHMVNNPDATFSNDLDNIIPGLSQAFAQHYGLTINGGKNFEIPNYVQTSNGKFIKYNIEHDNIYCCANNIIVCNGEERQLPPEKFLLFDNYVLDLETSRVLPANAIDLRTNRVKSYLPPYYDAFIKSLGEIKSAKRVLNKDGMKIILTPEEGEPVEIDLNNRNQIIGYSNPNVEIIGNNFLDFNTTLTTLSIPNAKKIGSNCLYFNTTLTTLDASNATKFGYGFLNNNNSLTTLCLPKAEIISSSFLYYNNSLRELYLPNVQFIDILFLKHNTTLKKLYAPKLKTYSMTNEYILNLIKKEISSDSLER